MIERPSLSQTETITTDNLKDAAARLGRLIWEGNYKEALPLADRILAFRTEQGARDAALIPYASNYYSAASRFWKEKNLKSTAKCMNTALRALQERLEQEIERQGGKKGGLIPVSLENLTSNELDVMQAIYARASEMADRIPLVKPLRQLLLSKERDPVRDFDAAALLAIRAGLKKVREEKSAGAEAAPHTEIFLETGSFDIAKRYGWNEAAATRTTRIFEIADAYPWPPEQASEEAVAEEMSGYGQAARVARHLRDVARQAGEDARAQEFERRARAYAAFIPDQLAKL